MPMAGKVKTWVWVLVGIAVVGVLFVIASAAIGFYVFSQHVDTRKVTASTATAEFDKVRARFSGTKPLIELDERGDLLRTNTDRAAPANPRPLEGLHVMAFDPDDGGFVQLRIPFWLLRMQPDNAKIDLGGQRVDLEDLKLTVQDLERFGPALVLDQKSRGGDRVLVWTQ
jgi:hypothetical protein